MLPSFRWDQVGELLDDAMSLPPEERTKFLHNACTDEALRQYLSSLVLSPVETSGLLESWSAIAGSAVGAGEMACASTPPASLLPTLSLEDEFKPGDRIGAYVLTEKLGEGGMGVVYRAVRADDHYLKSVAIKLMRAEFSSRVNQMRFRVERQVLASLEHPHIARLLDGGATDRGMPYVVLELVEGEPIDVYCDARSLPVSDRLRLFQSVCDAVQFAHQHLVIHRDLKPSNVLVTAEGQVKLLDFGIAKILAPDSFPQEVEATLPLVRMLSPEYASPEQVRGEAVSTTSDVYSLGVLLYQLLTGRKPYTLTTGSLAELNNVVCETIPVRPSAAVLRTNESATSAELAPAEISRVREGTPERLKRRLQGDLDCIVLKAMRKEPERRYQSVKELADDLQRHLTGLPVSARADTLTYRVSRFTRRYKTLVIAAAIIVITLTAGILLTLHEARVALAEKARAERRFNNVRGLAHSNIFELFDAIEKLPNSEAARHLAVQRAVQTLDDLRRDADGDRALQAELASGYEKIGDIQGAYSGAGIGDTAAAVASYERALSMHPRLHEAEHEPVEELKRQAMLQRKIARSYVFCGRIDEAALAATKALRLATQSVERSPADSDLLSLLARSHLMLAGVLGGSGSSSSTRQLPEAISQDEQALKIIEQYQRVNGSKASDLLMTARMSLAFHLSKARRFKEATRTYDQALGTERDRSLLDPSDLALLYNYRGLNFERQAEHTLAAAAYRTGLALDLVSFQKRPNDIGAKLGVAIAHAHIATQDIRLRGRAAASEASILEEAVHTVERLYREDPAESFYASLLVIGYAYQGEVASLLGDAPAAQKHIETALSMSKDLSERDPNELESRLSTAKLYVSLSRVAAQRGQSGPAQSAAQKAIESVEEILKQRPSDAESLVLQSTVRALQKTLSHCERERICPGASEIAFPSMIN